MLGEAVSSLLKPLDCFAESGREVSLEKRPTRRWFLKRTLYCRDVSEAKDISAAFRVARRQHLYVEYHSAHKKDMGRESSSRVVAKTMETQKKIKACQERMKICWGVAVVKDDGRK